MPAGATAVALNVTETNPTAAGFATVWPAGIARPDPASNLNFVPGKTAPNLVVVPLGANSKVSLYNSAGSTDFVAVDIKLLPGHKPGASGADLFYSNELLPEYELTHRTHCEVKSEPEQQRRVHRGFGWWVDPFEWSIHGHFFPVRRSL